MIFTRDLHRQKMTKTKIEWADTVWNFVTGCTKVSSGCKNCYAERMAIRLAGRAGYPVNDPFNVTLHQDKLFNPLFWKKPRRVFVNSMSDLFHNEISDGLILTAFAIMALTPQHTYMILTKRPKRMYEFLARDEIVSVIGAMAEDIIGTFQLDKTSEFSYPLKNVWLGTSIENQSTADDRVPWVLRTPAIVRFVSYEPALAPVNFENFIDDSGFVTLDWVIMGGESGPGARPMNPSWVRSVRDRCQAFGVPFFFKQWGEWKFFANEPGTSNPIYERVGKKKAGRLFDGREWNEYPDVKTAY